MSPLDATTAAWILKNERDTLGNHDAAIAALRDKGDFLRVFYAPPVAGEWEILAVEPADPPPAPLTLYRRADHDHSRGLFWSSSRLEAWLHTVGRSGLTMYSHTFEPGDLVAEFVIRDRQGRESGGEFIAIPH